MRGRYIFVVALGALIAGCSNAKVTETPAGSTPVIGGSMTSTTPASSPTVAERYQAAANALDAAYLRWNAIVSSTSELSNLTRPSAVYGEALSSFNREVLDLGITRMPPSTDIQALVREDTTVIADLNSVGTQSPATLAEWSARVATDTAKANQAGEAVRIDLGLAP